MRLQWVGIALGIGVASAGCATHFTGSAHIEGGRPACEAKCRGQGMQIAGMVYMGEYSSACVCEVPRGTSSAGRHEVLAAAAGGSGAAAGVIMQMQEEERQRQAMMH